MSNTEVWSLVTVFTVEELLDELKNRGEKELTQEFGGR